MRPAAWLFGFTLLAAAISPAWGQVSSHQLLVGLDLQSARLDVHAPPSVQAHLLDRLRERAAAARLIFPDPHSPHSGQLPLLTLSVHAQPLGEVCHFKSLIHLSLDLMETVIPIRTSMPYTNSTWIAESPPTVRDSPSPASLAEEAAALFDRFVVAYTRANGAGSPPHAAPEVPRAGPPAPAPPASSVDATLATLTPDALQFDLLTTHHGAPLRHAALTQLAEAGLPLPLQPPIERPVTLSLELLQHPLAPDCPGQVLYEAGLFLVEEVVPARAPTILLWSDTWACQQVQVVPPRTPEQLDADRERLVAAFLRDRHTAIHPALGRRGTLRESTCPGS